MRVIVRSSEMLEYSEQAEEQYGSWTEHWDFMIDRVFKAADDYKATYSEDGFLVEDGPKVYILVMRYDTGDSFGNASGKGVVIHVFGNQEVANAALEALKSNQDSYSIQVMDDFGREISLSNPGAGYFETINDIELQEYSV